jgi:hypothetical protein
VATAITNNGTTTATAIMIFFEDGDGDGDDDGGTNLTHKILKLKCYNRDKNEVFNLK